MSFFRRPMLPLLVMCLAALLMRSPAAPAESSGARVLVGLISHQPTPGGSQANLRALEVAVRASVKSGAQFVVLPELSTTGSLSAQIPADQLAAEGVKDGPSVRHWKALCQELGVWLVVPILERTQAGRVEVALVLLNARGEIAMVQHKTLARTGREDGAVSRASFREMQDSVVANGVRVGIVSGDDLRVGVARLANRGAELVLAPSGWMKSDADPWRDLALDLARENRVTIAAVSREENAPFNGVFSSKGSAAPIASGDNWTVVPAALATRKWAVPSAMGLPAIVPVPAVDTGSDEIAALGERLFYDTNLSANGKVACATCHDPEKGFSNGLSKGTGVYGRTTKRNVPTLLNVAFRPLLQWDGYASSLENFAKYPFSGVAEMNFHYVDKVPTYLRRQASYVAQFASSMGVKEIEFEHVASALAAYQRTLISAESPFDRYFYGGEPAALDEPAKRGLALFQGKANCTQCHRIEKEAALFMDFQFHVTGHGYNRDTGLFNDIGLGSISTADQTGMFQTPTLRNVALTAPYMHDGGLATLEEVVAFYNRGGNANPRLDPMMRPLGLTVSEQADLVAFLKSLTGSRQYRAPSVRKAVPKHSVVAGR